MGKFEHLRCDSDIHQYRIYNLQFSIPARPEQEVKWDNRFPDVHF